MVKWNPGDLRKATTLVGLLLISSEAIDFHAPPLAWQHAPYMLPSTAADYGMVHVEPEEFAQNLWGASRVSASDSSSGAMWLDDSRIVESLHDSLNTSGFFLLLDADSTAIKSENK